MRQNEQLLIPTALQFLTYVIIKSYNLKFGKLIQNIKRGLI